MKNKIQIGSNKSFGFVFFFVFLIIGIFPIKNGESINFFYIAISMIFLFLGAINSKFLTPLNKIWFKFGIILGSVISPIIMGLAFFLVVTPTSFILKIFKKDVLNLKKNNDKSYWITKPKINNSLKNQF
jgi:energy-coupling factor transporter transmembrane protein EcfT